MRRLNTRKRNKLNLKNLNKKTLRLICILLIFLILLIIIFIYFMQNLFIKKNFEKSYSSLSEINQESPFTLEKIILFSSATATTNDLSNSVWNLNISQFSDICIYLNNAYNDNSAKKLIQSIYIDSINISKTECGTPLLYSKSIEDFGKCSFEDNKIIDNRFDFNVVNTDSDINYNNNELYNDLSTPITIGFYNKDIKSNYLYSDSQINYNGRILKSANIPEVSIKCNLSFNINIITQEEQEYICNVNIDIPFRDENSSIYEDGYIKKEISDLDNYKFLRVK